VPSQLRRRLARGQALAAIVPAPAWVVPAAAYVRSAFGPRWCFHTRDGADRKRDASVGSEQAARDLSKGHCVMGIAADQRLLPGALQSAADVVVRIPPPDGAVLRRAIARFAGRSLCASQIAIQRVRYQCLARTLGDQLCLALHCGDGHKTPLLIRYGAVQPLVSGLAKALNNCYILFNAGGCHGCADSHVDRDRGAHCA